MFAFRSRVFGAKSLVAPVSRRSFASEAWANRPQPKPGAWMDPKPEESAELRELEEATGIPADQLANPQLHFWTMRAEIILDQLNVAEADRDDFLAKHTLSPGYFTLEFALPSPPPVHCFSEPPVVKETV